MMNSTYEQEMIHDLLKSPGWDILKKELGRRREAALRIMISTRDLDDLVKNQVRVQELEVLLKLPEQIMEGQNGKTQNQDAR